MIDRVNSFLITLEKDIREDDAQALMALLYQIKGVVNVAPNISDYRDYVAYARAQDDIRGKIYDVFNKESLVR